MWHNRISELNPAAW